MGDGTAHGRIVGQRFQGVLPNIVVVIVVIVVDIETRG